MRDSPEIDQVPAEPGRRAGDRFTHTDWANADQRSEFRRFGGLRALRAAALQPAGRLKWNNVGSSGSGRTRGGSRWKR
jgi:hypothetical protein